MADYIKREDVIKTVCQQCRDVHGDGCDRKDECSMYERLRSISKADVVPRKNGTWHVALTSDSRKFICFVCSECGNGAYFYEIGEFKYCPKCGAKMEEKNEN